MERVKGNGKGTVASKISSLKLVHQLKSMKLASNYPERAMVSKMGPVVKEKALEKIY